MCDVCRLVWPASGAGGGQPTHVGWAALVRHVFQDREPQSSWFGGKPVNYLHLGSNFPQDEVRITAPPSRWQKVSLVGRFATPDVLHQWFHLTFDYLSHPLSHLWPPPFFVGGKLKDTHKRCVASVTATSQHRFQVPGSRFQVPGSWCCCVGIPPAGGSSLGTLAPSLLREWWTNEWMDG